MKRIAMIITMVVMVAVVGGFSVNAEQNRDVTYPVLSQTNNNEETEPYRFEVEELIEELAIPKDEIREASSVVSGGATWIYAKTQEGKTGRKTSQFQELYNNKDILLSKVEIPEASKTEKSLPTIYEGGQQAKADAFFDASSLTPYGANSEQDSSAGVGLGQNSVRQQDGTWEDGITYEGYYIVAASSAIPMYSILEVSDHSLSGGGIEAGVPFKAIVLDRNSSIEGSKIELFSGSNDSISVSQGSKQDAKVKIQSINNTAFTPEVIKVEPVVSQPVNIPAPAAASVEVSSSSQTSLITRYGVDCYGCNISSDGTGGTAAGIGVGLNSVRQSNGTWQEGITYDGYYIIAASSDIPIFSIVEVSNHSLSGMGISPGVPFQAIVLDRGGGVQGSHIDLFIGSQNVMPVSQGSPNGQVRVVG